MLLLPLTGRGPEEETDVRSLGSASVGLTGQGRLQLQQLRRITRLGGGENQADDLGMRWDVWNAM